MTDRQKYSFHITAGAGGTIPAGKEKEYDKWYPQGKKIKLTARANIGHSFLKWLTSNGGCFENEKDSRTIFIMPACDTVVTAVFQEL